MTGNLEVAQEWSYFPVADKPGATQNSLDALALPSSPLHSHASLIQVIPVSYHPSAPFGFAVAPLDAESNIRLLFGANDVHRNV